MKKEMSAAAKKEISAAAKKEILLVADAVSNEKGVDRNVIFEAIELA